MTQEEKQAKIDAFKSEREAKEYESKIRKAMLDQHKQDQSMKPGMRLTEVCIDKNDFILLIVFFVSIGKVVDFDKLIFVPGGTRSERED